MGIFNRFRKGQNGNPVVSGSNVGIPALLPGNENGPGSSIMTSKPVRGIDDIYAFLQFDYESRGYNDALTNPDESYKNDNIKLIQHDLMILIERTLTYYEATLRETDFHISSRSRAGLIDLVEELKIRKDVTAGHLEKVKQLKAEAASGGGSTQRIVLSYQRGFMRGLYAISQSKLFNGGI